MAEKIKTAEQSKIKTVDTDTLWIADTISNLQKEAALSNEEAALVLYGRILTEIKKLETENPSVLLAVADSHSKKTDKTIELSLILSQILTKEETSALKKFADSNKFRPIEISVTQNDIFREREAYLDVSQTKELGELQAQELATCNKIIETLLARIFAGDGTQQLADIFSLSAKNPELAADLGKIIQAAEIIRLHRKHLGKITKQDAERAELIKKAGNQAREKIMKPVVYIKELLGQLSPSATTDGQTLN